MNALPVKISPDSESTFNPERMHEACQSLGLTHLPADSVRMFKALGEEIERAGAIRMTSAGVFVSFQWCLRAMEKLSKDLESEADLETRANIGRTIGYLGNAVSKAGKQIVDASPLASETLKKNPARESFVPFAAVVVNNNAPAQPQQAHAIEVDSIPGPGPAISLPTPGPD